MATDKKDALVPSILDRLVDPESSGTAAAPGYSLGQVMEAVKRDLQELLNTHQTLSDKAVGLARVERVLGYGMPDLVSKDTNRATFQEIAQALEKALRLYEPRLRDIRAEMLEPTSAEPHKVRFHLTARLNVEPNPEVAVDTVLQLTSGQFLQGS